MSKNSGGWAFLCSVIANKSGLKPWRLECACQVGTGDGQLWRAWMRGTRIARDISQEKVLLEARKKGWLGDLTDRQINDIVAGTTSIGVAALAARDSRLPAVLPLPPNDLIPRPTWALANRAAGLLLRDQQTPTSKEAQSRLANKDWWRAVQAVEAMLKTKSNQSVLVELTAAYLRQFSSMNLVEP